MKRKEYQRYLREQQRRQDHESSPRGYYDANGYYHAPAGYPDQPNLNSEYNPNQSTGYYQQPRPKRHHHILLSIVIIAIILIGGIAYLGSRQPSPNASRQPQTVKKTTINNNHPAGEPNNYSANQKIDRLQSEMHQIGLTQAEQQKALNYYRQQNATQQAHLYQDAQRIEHSVPTNAAKRLIIEHVINH